MYYDMPFQKTFTTPIDTSVGRCILKYKQNSFGETVMMLQNYDKPDYIFNWLKDFVKENGEFPKKAGMKQRMIEDIMKNPVNVFGRIWGNINRMHKSIFDGIEVKGGGRKATFACSVKSVCETYNISGPKDLFDNYTYEQWQWMLDGMVFINNENNPKGQQMNDRAFFKIEKEENDELLDYIKNGPKKKHLDQNKPVDGNSSGGVGSTD